MQDLAASNGKKAHYKLLICLFIHFNLTSLEVVLLFIQAEILIIIKCILYSIELKKDPFNY